MPKNAIAWFEIPVTDLDRAAAFYERIMDVTLTRMEVGTPVATFPSDDEGVGGALTLDESRPSGDGSLVYLDVDGHLQEVLDRVAEAGGEILLPRTEIGNDYGFYAYIRDTEGNRVGFFENV
jgi:predicted enzyme related to lactoylglutathione lyase